MASQTPEPLPLPPVQPEMGPLDLMLMVAGNATNGTHPDAVVGAAQIAKTPEEAVTNAQAIAGYSNAALATKNLRSRPRPTRTRFGPRCRSRSRTS